jgi:hypothetical protein
MSKCLNANSVFNFFLKKKRPVIDIGKIVIPHLSTSDRTARIASIYFDNANCFIKIYRSVIA